MEENKEEISPKQTIEEKVQQDIGIVNVKKSLEPYKRSITHWRMVRGLRSILKSLAKGGSIQSACKAASICPSTLWKWRRENPRIEKLICGVLDARNQTMEDAHYKSGIEGNVTAQMNWLYNRASDRWTDRRAVPQQINLTKVTSNKISVGEIDEAIIATVRGNLESLRKYGIIDATSVEDKH